jgi:hypothetical protein
MHILIYLSNIYPVPCLPYGSIWSKLMLYGTIWWKPVPDGAIWLHMVERSMPKMWVTLPIGLRCVGS